MNDNKMSKPLFLEPNLSPSTVSLCIILLISLGGCSHFDRITEGNNPPPLTAIKNPIAQPGYRPVQLPMPHATPASFQPNSLWQTGSRAFFKDQRAARVGDLLTVLIDITDSAKFNNATARDRNGTNSFGIDALGGYGKLLTKILPGSPDPSRLVDVNSNTASSGSGSVNRQESLTTQMTAVVMQALPNGNLVIEGRQEVRVNGEVRELIVAGIVRPEDISGGNTIPISKIGEARVSYGGRGDISEMQKTRYGQKVLDVILPF